MSITTTIAKARYRAKDRLFLMAIAPTGHILARTMLGSALSPEQIAEKTLAFQQRWSVPYRPAGIVSPIADFLL